LAVAYVLPLEAIDNRHVGIAGGKGASLGELIRAGLPVPSGFVVTRSAFDAFMAVADRESRVSKTIGQLERRELEPEAASSDLLETLSSVPAPLEIATAIEALFPSLETERVSVRSSATCEDGSESAWAGQLNTYLGVPLQDIVDRVRDCWLSIFRPSALAYGAAHGYGGGQFGVAVVVQTMIASEISGIGFSVHPVTQEPGIHLIEAGLGQGEAIVSGQIVPDQYIVSAREKRILDRVVAHQKKAIYLGEEGVGTRWQELTEARGKAQKLTDLQILEYSGLLGRIHDHYRRPVDTEWAMTDGRFHVIQARPITTLAAEYDQALVDEKFEWQAGVRRPMSLLEVSILAHWMDTEHAGTQIGFKADHFLNVQDDAGMANMFLTREACEVAFENLTQMIRSDRPRLIALLRRSLQMSEAGTAGVKVISNYIHDMKSAGEYFIEVGEFTTSLPAWLLKSMDLAHIDDPEIHEIAQILRAQTLYPSVERQVVEPVAMQVAEEIGFSEPEQIMHVASWHELCERSVTPDTLDQRLEWVREEKKFVYQCLKGRESLRFVSETGYLMSRIARMRQVPQTEDPNVIRGQTAWPGVHRGRARVVLAPDAVGQTINDGEVLVSIQSSPALMPLLTRAGAIVTDEGGVACHAAIICRELKIPTLIGTARATHDIRTGDLLEVDATAGEVRVLERVES